MKTAVREAGHPKGGQSSGMPMRLLMGADQASAFHTWKEYRKILKIAAPVVALRPPIASRRAMADMLLARGAWTAHESDLLCNNLVRLQVSTSSSTSARAGLTTHAEAPRPRSRDSVVLPVVAAYAAARDIYQANRCQ